MAEDDRYTIPGSGGVLRNKLGHTTQTGVDGAMNRAATTQWAIVQTEPIPDQLDLEYLRGLPADEFAETLADRWGTLTTGGSALLV